MSGLSTKECDRYLFAGSSGWSILNEPADFESVPSTSTLPANRPASPELLRVVANSPWAFPDAGTDVMTGVEIEGYLHPDGRLALFPRTFYEIAGAYFGRSAPPSSLQGGRSTDPEARHDDPGLIGALRRLTNVEVVRLIAEELLDFARSTTPAGPQAKLRPRLSCWARFRGWGPVPGSG
jgi:hypothetical protein